jgi:hypothetical protein
MTDLLDFLIENHGGADRWDEAWNVSAMARSAMSALRRVLPFPGAPSGGQEIRPIEASKAAGAASRNT